MLKQLTLMATAGAISALITVSASALPVAPVKQATTDSQVTLVRDGCGPGRRFSNGRGHCVRQHQGWRERRRGRTVERAVGELLFGDGNRHHRRDRWRHRRHRH